MIRKLAATALAACALAVAGATDASAASGWRYAGTTPYGAVVNVYSNGNTFWEILVDTSNASTDERIYWRYTDSCGGAGDLSGFNDWQQHEADGYSRCHLLSVGWVSTEASGRDGSGSVYFG